MSLSPQESLRGSKLPEFATSSSFVMSSGRFSPPPPRQRVGVNAISPGFLPKASTNTRSSASFMRYSIVGSSASRPSDSRDTLDTSVSDLIHHWLQHSVPLRGCFRVRKSIGSYLQRSVTTSRGRRVAASSEYFERKTRRAFFSSAVAAIKINARKTWGSRTFDLESTYTKTYRHVAPSSSD